VTLQKLGKLSLTNLPTSIYNKLHNSCLNPTAIANEIMRSCVLNTRTWCDLQSDYDSGGRIGGFIRKIPGQLGMT